jgi:signal transduction histidine kinase
VAAYRIVSEAVANAIRHSGGSRCEVALRADQEVLRIEVCDDGSGLPADAEPHVSLLSMLERADELGGRLIIESRPGRTSITATIPLTVKP